MKVYDRYFSWNDFLDYVDWQKPNSIECSHNEYNADWFGTPTFKDAIHLARYGWVEFLHKVNQTDIDCWDILNNIQLWETKHSVTGSCVDMGRYLVGMPDNMFVQESIFNERFHVCPKFVNIVVNVSQSCERSVKYIFNRGINILSAINTLETNNIKIRVVLMECIEQYGQYYRIFIPIKEYQDVFYLEKLMFPIAHASFLRRLIFSAKEREPKNIRDIFGFYNMSGYGYPANYLQYDPENTLYFGTSLELNKQEIQHWINEVMNGNPKNYDGNSDFDKYLEFLKQQMNKGETTQDLQKYMQEKTEKYNELLKDLKQRELSGLSKHPNKSEQNQNNGQSDKSESQSFGGGNTGEKSQDQGRSDKNTQSNKTDNTDKSETQSSGDKQTDQDQKSGQSDKSNSQSSSGGNTGEKSQDQGRSDNKNGKCDKCQYVIVNKPSCLPALAHQNAGVPAPIHNQSRLPVLASFYSQYKFMR